MDAQTLVKTITRVTSDGVELSNDILAVEEPLEMMLQYGEQHNRITRQMGVTMRTPGHDHELATGFLFAEGVIRHADEVLEIKSTGDNNILVSLKPGVVPRLENAERNFYTTSSCGVCGKANIDSIRTYSPFQNTPDEIRILPELLHKLEAKLISRQNIFSKTGGLHSSAIFDLNGNYLDLREDVGRHNALDKLIGASLLMKRFPLSDNVLLLSGRASFELIQKASMAGIKVVVAVGAPSSLAVELAIEMKMTLIGFLRDERFNIYTGAERIILPVMAN